MSALPDHLIDGLRAVFVGINPGTRSAATGHHYAGRGNRFWRLLSEAGLIAEPLTAGRDAELPGLGFGLTNLVARESPGVGDLAGGELTAGADGLRQKLARHRPEWVVFVGLTVYRAVFGHRGALSCGPQAPLIGDTRTWVLPNPSGRNTHYTYQAMLDLYRALAEQLARPRFVLLAHHTDPFHHDLLLEQEAACATWRLHGPPEAPTSTERIADHRKHYLTFEGEVPGGRGRVARVDRGWYRREAEGVRLTGLAGERRLALD